MKLHNLLALSVVLLLKTLAPSSLAAQSCTVTNTATCSVAAGASITVPGIYRLNIGTTGSAAGTITIANMNAGYIDIPLAQLPTISVLTNQNWRVQVSAPALWTGVGGSAWASKPVGNLLWGYTAGTIATPMTASPVTVASGGPTQSTVVPIYYRIMLNWVNDTQGSYTLVVSYTLVSP